MATTISSSTEPRLTKAQLQFKMLLDELYEKLSDMDRAEAERIAHRSDIGVETISRQTAVALAVKHNLHNREVSLTKVAKFRGAMNRGEWRLINNGVAFYPNGQIADGQHRILALATSDTDAQPFMIFPKFDETSLYAIDTDGGRTAAHFLELADKEQDAKLKNAVAKDVMSLQHLIDEGNPLTGITNLQVRDFVIANKDLFNWAVDLGRKSVEKVSDAPLSEREVTQTAVMLGLGGYPHGWISGYVAAIQQGLEPYPDSPHGVVGERILKAKKAEKNQDKLTAKERYAILMKAALYAANEKKVKRVAWDSKKEGFPTNHPPHQLLLDDDPDVIQDA